MNSGVIKICGITNTADALAALAMGADYLGFVLYAGSRRAITADILLDISAGLPAEARRVGVFVNEKPDVVLRIAQNAALCAVQLHGDEVAQEWRGFPMPLWRAVRWDGNRWQPDPNEWEAERFVADAHVPGTYGGTGQTGNWDCAGALAVAAPVMLAGGLSADNVAAAIRRVRPLGVDAVGGTEAQPGIKDHERMRCFLEAARAAFRDLAAAEREGEGR